MRTPRTGWPLAVPLVLGLLLTACSASPSPTTSPTPEASAQAGDSITPDATLPARSEDAGTSLTASTADAFKTPTESPFRPGTVVLQGTWDFIVLFRGEPFSGTMQLPGSTVGTRGRVTLIGLLEGVVTVRQLDSQRGTVVLALETPRGTATLKGRFETVGTVTGSLEDLMVRRSGSADATTRLEETAAVSATRR